MNKKLIEEIESWLKEHNIPIDRHPNGDFKGTHCGPLIRSTCSFLPWPMDLPWDTKEAFMKRLWYAVASVGVFPRTVWDIITTKSDVPMIGVRSMRSS